MIILQHVVAFNEKIKYANIFSEDIKTSVSCKILVKLDWEKCKIELQRGRAVNYCYKKVKGRKKNEIIQKIMFLTVLRFLQNGAFPSLT